MPSQGYEWLQEAQNWAAELDRIYELKESETSEESPELDKLWEEDYTAWQSLALAWTEAGYLDRAEEIVRQRPQDSDDLLLGIAERLTKSRDWDNSERLVERIQAQGLRLEALETLALALLDASEAARAQSVFEKLNAMIGLGIDEWTPGKELECSPEVISVQLICRSGFWSFRQGFSERIRPNILRVAPLIKRLESPFNRILRTIDIADGFRLCELTDDAQEWLELAVETLKSVEGKDSIEDSVDRDYLLSLLGTQYSQIKRYDQSLACFDAIENQPELETKYGYLFDDRYNDLVWALADAGLWTQAIAVADHEPDQDTRDLNYFAVYYSQLEQGEYDQARETARLCPKYATHVELSIVGAQLDNNQPELARETIRNVRPDSGPENNPDPDFDPYYDCLEFYCNLAQYYLQLEDFDSTAAALENLKRCVQRDRPNNRHVAYWSWLAKLWKDLDGKVPDAISQSNAAGRQALAKIKTLPANDDWDGIGQSVWAIAMFDFPAALDLIREFKLYARGVKMTTDRILAEAD